MAAVSVHKGARVVRLIPVGDAAPDLAEREALGESAPREGRRRVEQEQAGPWLRHQRRCSTGDGRHRQDSSARGVLDEAATVGTATTTGDGMLEQITNWVVLMFENRSFDSLLGHLPHIEAADGIRERSGLGLLAVGFLPGRFGLPASLPG
jgi:hypothetical protein